jgi:toxin ParE1/3/4
MTPRRVILRPSAETDLINLYHYIAERSGYPERAMGYIRRIRTYCETLVSFPERGTRRDDLRPGLWVIGFERRVVIAYAARDGFPLGISGPTWGRTHQQPSRTRLTLWGALAQTLPRDGE